MTTTYENSTGGGTITCLICGLISHNPHDIANRYCRFCHVFHDDEFTGVVYHAVVERKAEHDGVTVVLDCGHECYYPIPPRRDVAPCGQCLQNFIEGSSRSV